MRDQILASIDNPAQLEKLYRMDRPAFARAFNALYPELKNSALTGFWHARLSWTKDEVTWGSRLELIYVIIASLLAGFIAKLPAVLQIDEELFYTRNIGFVVFPLLVAYFAWKQKLSAGKIAFIAGTILVGVVFINLLPDVKKSDTLILSCIHLVLFLWSVLGFAFVGGPANHVERRLAYLKYNGDLVVMTTLILISGAILTGITIGLFSLLQIQIEEFYFKYVAVFGLSAAPILGTYLTQTNPQLVGRVSPVIAKLFSPLVLAMLVIYLVAIVYSGKDPYNDRDFLLLFNALLLGVMAIIFFSVAGTSGANKSHAETWVLFLLSAVTIVVNGIALSAILFRISEWGITPNRAAVLGGNLLILVNLFLVTGQFFWVLRRKAGINSVGKVISSYLPLYCLWAVVVTFLFPYLFGFK